MALPPGLLLNPATGELTGTPTVPGTFAIQLEVRDTLGSRRQLEQDVVINSYTPMTWSGSLGPLMATRAPLAVNAARSGGLAPFIYSVQGGSLPNGMSLNATTGAITGTPTDPGAYAVTIRATDSLNQHADYLLAGTVAANLTLTYPGTHQGTVSVGMTLIPSPVGGNAPYAYSYGAGVVPPGLALNHDNGNIAGTPTAPSSADFYVVVTDANGYTATEDEVFDIVAYPTLSDSLAHATVGRAYNSSFAGAGGHVPYAWSATGLPPGLSINAGTGAITGTPTTPGSYSVVVTLTDNLVVTATRTQVIEVVAALAISGGYAATAPRAVVYPNFNPTRVGGWAPYSYDISVGALPTGLSLDAGTGVISGTPTAQGAYTATLRVTDADGNTATMAFNVTIAGDLSLTGTPANFGTTTVAYNDSSLGHTGGQTPYVFSIASGALPNGLSLNSSTGAITGTPTVPGTYNFTVKVSDANASYATGAFSITVAAFPALAGTLPDASNGVAYSASYGVSGGHAPLAYDISAGTLPTGLTINASTGVISGTPTVNGASTFTVRVTDNHGNITTRAGTVTVYATPTTAGSYANSMEVGIAYSSNAVTASGGKPPLAWAKVGGTLPPGLSVDGNNGTLSGTPTATGSYNFTVRVTDALGQFFQQNFIRSPVAHVAITSAYSSAMEEGVAYNKTPVISGGVAPFSYDQQGSIPLGCTFNSSTGNISGSPTPGASIGTYNGLLTVTDALGAFAQVNTQLVVRAAVGITSNPPDGTIGVAYSGSTTGNNGWAPYTYALQSGSLPAGCSLNSSTGVISGTPTTAAIYNPVIRVTDALGATATVNPSIEIRAFPTLVLNYGRGTVGQAYSGTVTPGLGWAPYTYAYTGNAIGGLGFSASTGAIAGTPTAAATYTAITTLTDAKGNRVTRSVSIVIASPLTISGSYPGGKVGVAYSSTLGQAGGWTPRTFSKVAGTLPTGLALSGAGTLSGTPSAAGTFNFTVRLTDTDGGIVEKAMSVVIAASSPLNVTAAPNPASDYVEVSGGTSATVAAAVTASVTGGVAPYTYSWTRLSHTTYAGSGVLFTYSGTTTNILHVSHSDSFDYDCEEVWRCTVRDAASVIDTVDVPIQLTVNKVITPGGMV